MNIRILIECDTATPILAQVAQMVENNSGMFAAAGHRLVRDTSQHVRQWGLSHANKLGGKRTNYWGHIAEKINPAETLAVAADSATVTLGGDDMPGLMRAFGDVTILPGTKTAGAKYIPLAARSEVYGLRPREVPGLVLFWKGKGQVGGLAEGVSQTRTKNTKRGAKGSTYLVPGLVMYWFAESVTQPQDRTLLPSDEDWSESVNTGAKEYVGIQLKKIMGGGV